MANLMQINCGTFIPNTGYGTCPVNLGLVLGMLAIPRGTVYDISTQILRDGLPVTLATSSNNALGGVRTFPIGQFVSATDSSTDSTVESFDYGGQGKVRDGVFVILFRTTNGEFCYYQSLRGFDNSQDRFDYLLVTAKGIIGSGRPDPITGITKLGGIRTSLIDVPLFKFATGTTRALYTIKVTIQDSTQLLDNMQYVPTASNVMNTITGLANVQVSGPATISATPVGSVDLQLNVTCGGDNLYDIYGPTLATIGNFIATNTTTGATITITGVTQIASTKSYRIQMDITDTDYPATGQKATIALATVPTLFTAGIVGYEASNSITVTH